MRNPFARAVKLRDGFPVMPGAFPLVGHIPVVYRGLADLFQESRGLGPMVWVTFGFGMWTLVAVDLWGISHDEKVFPEPFEYRPARWLSRKTPPSPLEISQFGAGPHFCLGYHLAWLEGVQFAVALAKKAAEKNLRPILRDLTALRPIFLPTEHPTPKAVVGFV